MSLTRRSFIKKSSYSVAAVTALGTGVGLADIQSSNPKKVYKAKFKNKLCNETDNIVYTDPDPNVAYDKAEKAGNDYRRNWALQNLTMSNKKSGHGYTVSCRIFTPDPPTNYNLVVRPSGNGFIWELTSSGAGSFTMQFFKKP